MQTNLKRYAELRSGLLWEAMSGESRLDAVKIAPALVHGKVLGEAGKSANWGQAYDLTILTSRAAWFSTVRGIKDSQAENRKIVGLTPVWLR